MRLIHDLNDHILIKDAIQKTLCVYHSTELYKELRLFFYPENNTSTFAVITRTGKANFTNLEDAAIYYNDLG